MNKYLAACALCFFPAVLLTTGCVQVQNGTGVYRPSNHMPAAYLPKYVPGEYFTYNGTNTFTVEKVKQDKIKWKFNGGTGYAYRDFVLPFVQRSAGGKKTTTTVDVTQTSLWPLKVGKTANFTTKRKAFAWGGSKKMSPGTNWECKVVGTPRVSVPAGTFNTYKVACERFNMKDGRWQGKTKYYYSPAIGHYVKKEIVNNKRTVVQELTDSGFNKKYLSSTTRNNIAAHVNRTLRDNYDGESAKWRSSHSNFSVEVTPVNSFMNSRREKCRDYKMVYYFGNKVRDEGTVRSCKNRLGKWYTVK